MHWADQFLGLLTLPYLLAGLLAGYLAVGAIVLVAPKIITRHNFRGSVVIAGTGIVFMLAVAISMIPFSLHPETRKLAVFVDASVLGFGVLGLVDDLFGDRSVGGLRGHLNCLLRSGKLTTGLVKAFGGALIGMAVGFAATGSVWRAVLAGASIALTANFLNLTDTRPGRCLFAAVLSLEPTAHYVATHGFPPISIYVTVLAVLAAIYLPDKFGTMMLGDAGSNSVGAICGLMIALWTPVWICGLWVTLLVLFHVWTEAHSLTAWINSNVVLKTLDRKLGVREERAAL